MRAGVFLLMLMMFLLCLLFLTRYKPDNSSSRILTPPVVHICHDAGSRERRLPRAALSYRSFPVARFRSARVV